MFKHFVTNLKNTISLNFVTGICNIKKPLNYYYFLSFILIVTNVTNVTKF